MSYFSSLPSQYDIEYREHELYKDFPLKDVNGNGLDEGFDYIQIPANLSYQENYYIPDSLKEINKFLLDGWIDMKFHTYAKAVETLQELYPEASYVTYEGLGHLDPLEGSRNYAN